MAPTKAEKKLAEKKPVAAEKAPAKAEKKISKEGGSDLKKKRRSRRASSTSSRFSNSFTPILGFRARLWGS